VSSLRRRLEARIAGEFEESPGPGAAARIAEEAARSGYGRVVAAGGDGTVREVACGLYRGGGGPRLGIVPVGTGNDLAFGLGLPADVDRAAAVACGERTVGLDLIEARAGEGQGPAQVATNAVVAGFCGRIADSMQPRLRRGLRRIAYPLAALSQLRDLGPYRTRLSIDGRWVETEALMIIVANGTSAGGRVPLAPGADPTDGILDLVVVHAVRPWKLAGLVPRVLLGRHAGHADVSIFKVKAVRVESDPPMWMNLDGDTWQVGPASFRVLPGALRVAVP
jgi:diacylglycerol kinase (ATP)